MRKVIEADVSKSVINAMRKELENDGVLKNKYCKVWFDDEKKTIYGEELIVADPNFENFEDIDKASELARVKDFIEDLSEGYQTIVGERGVGLSGGQKQRIALARLFLANPKIMILDDTTSAVDNETEYKIRQSIKSQSQGHTSFIISHRVSSFENCDVILVLQNGELVQMGSHEELMAQSGYYKTVWNEQNEI